MQDAQVAALGQLAPVALAGEEPAMLPRLPIELSLTPPSALGPPPAAGEHGRAILHEAGYTDAEIEELIRRGAVGA
jgi:crotonobetainyl-CoA:carnitine CoA-transferase CaiB-like acyl-CoA transferase